MVKSKEDELCIYCGMKKVPPKGARFGTAEECLKKNQVKLYGIKKINPKLVDEYIKNKESKPRTVKNITKMSPEEEKRRDMRNEYLMLRGKEKRIQKYLLENKEISKEDKDKLEKKLDEIQNKLKILLSQVDIF